MKKQDITSIATEAKNSRAARTLKRHLKQAKWRGERRSGRRYLHLLSGYADIEALDEIIVEDSFFRP